MSYKEKETEPLLQRSGRSSKHSYGVGSDIIKEVPQVEIVEEVKLKRHINLPYAVAIIIGNVIGSGIFVSPVGVTTNSGSVGASLVIWAMTGVYNLCQALCYAELGTTIPKAGGDYVYLYEILGPLFGFMTAWIHLVVIAASSCAVIARTAGLYIIQPLELACREDIITLIAVWIIVTLAAINAFSALWGTRVHTLFTVAKTVALGIIIIAGIVKLGQGYTDNFQGSFQGTNTNPGSLAVAVLDGYFAYKGWELINALPEEMINPSRDLPIATVIALLSVTGIYVLTNVAYFSVLSPKELVSSNAVALLFAEKALGPVAPIIPVAVALSCMGTVNGDFLSNSRYLFAGGRYRQVPKVFSFIHARYYTPMIAVAMMAVLAILYCVFTDLQVLQEYASLTVQFKMLMVLSALFYLRWKEPHLERPFKVNTILAVVTFLIMIALVVLSFIDSPVVSGIGVGVFLAGLPLYFIIILIRDRQWSNKAMEKVTVWLQKLLQIVPESSTPPPTVTKRKH